MSAERVHAEAQRLAAMGLPLHPVQPWVGNGEDDDGKRPALTGWPDRASIDAKRVDQWFAPGARAAIPNVGAAMGHVLPDGRYAFALDVDIKNGKPGVASLEQLCKDTGVNPDDIGKTLTQRTPSGGWQFIFSTERPLGSTSDALGKGLDTRGLGGFSVVPPSTINGKPYTWIDPDAPILPLPAAIEARLAVAGLRERATQAPNPRVDHERAYQRGIEYLKTASRPVEGNGSDNETSAICRTLKDKGLTKEQTFDLMMSEHWDNGCGFDAEWIGSKIDNAWAYAKEAPGCDAPEAQFSAILAPDAGAAGAHPLDRLNQDYAFVLVGGTSYILWETTDADNRPSIEFLTVEAFNRKHAALTFQSGNQSRPLTQAWMEWPKRRGFDAVVFKPGKTLPARFYNLWRGFAVLPQAGDWSLMRAHIRDVICSGDPALDRYVMGWLARAVQLPGERGEVALVLRGGKGTGKGTLGEYLLRLFGHHGVHISNAKHLTGNFNGHLRAAAFVFGDEAFWAADKQHEGVLKQLVTERQIMIEAKGKDAVSSDNCIHLLLASNDQWVVPATADERRFCVIDVSDAQQQRTEHFGPLRKQMESGGLEAMLHDLLAFDLSSFDVRAVPQTKALGDQKLQSLTGPARWLFEAVNGARISGEPWADAELSISKRAAYEDYALKSRTLYKEYRPTNERAFWKSLKGLLERNGAPLRDVRPRNGARERCTVFPWLTAARAAFEAHMRTPIEWDEEPMNDEPARSKDDIFS